VIKKTKARNEKVKAANFISIRQDGFQKGDKNLSIKAKVVSENGAIDPARDYPPCPARKISPKAK